MTAVEKDPYQKPVAATASAPRSQQPQVATATNNNSPKEATPLSRSPVVAQQYWYSNTGTAAASAPMTSVSMHLGDPNYTAALGNSRFQRSPTTAMVAPRQHPFAAAATASESPT